MPVGRLSHEGILATEETSPMSQFAEHHSRLRASRRSRHSVVRCFRFLVSEAGLFDFLNFIYHRTALIAYASEAAAELRKRSSEHPSGLERAAPS